MDIEKIRDASPRLQLLPFNSSNKFMISANQLESSDQSVLITLKGAPDIFIPRCSAYKMNNDQIETLDDNIKNTLVSRQEELAKDGRRVIGMCHL